MGQRKGSRRITMVLGLTVGLVLATATPALAGGPPDVAPPRAAASSTAAATALSATAAAVDACTAVPDSGSLFDFTEPCLAHDQCYLTQPYGSTSAARRQCDQEFLAAMRATCADRYPDARTSRRGCRAVARLYYLGVRLLGGLAWDEGEAPALA